MSEFKKKLRSHPLAPKRPATIAVPDTTVTQTEPVPNETPHKAGTVRRPAFEIPVDDRGKPVVTLDSLVALSRNGHSVPMPIAREMTEKERISVQEGQTPSSNLTTFERDTLMKFGWQNGDPVPPDFAAELQTAFSEYVTRKQAEGIDYRTIKINRIEDLPPEEQTRLKVVMQSLIEKAKGEQHADTARSVRANQYAAYPEHVRQVLADVDFGGSAPVPQPVVTPPPEPVIPKEPPPIAPWHETGGNPFGPEEQEVPVTICQTCGRDPWQEKQRLVCLHCACDPLEDPEAVPIPGEDKRRYLIALGAKRPFEKEYTIFHETIEVRFRSLSQKELDELTLWAARSVREEKALPPQDVKSRIRHKEMLGSLVLQTRLLRSLVEGAELFWASPETPYPAWDDWKKEFDIGSMDELVRHYLEEIPAEAVILTLQKQMTRFNYLEYRLGREGNNITNFWQGT
jgi:hypothetical protein